MNFLNRMNHDNTYLTSPTNNHKSTSTTDHISTFLQSRQISISEFWKSELSYASAADLIQFCKLCGLELLQNDVINLKSQLFATKETIKVQVFAESVPFWHSFERQTISDFLKKRSDILIDKIKSKQRKRPNSSFPIRKPNPDITPVKTISRLASAQRFRKDPQNTTAILNKNNSLDHLKRYKQKEFQRQKELNDNIEKNKIDQQYGMLLKMSQLNTIYKQKGNNTTYRAYKSSEGTVKVRVFSLNQFKSEISLSEFDTIYKNFKKTTKENKDWTFVAHTQPKDTDELQNLKTRNTQKSERQQQLKSLLVNTVNLANLLKQQIKIFKMKGIYGCQNV